MTDLQYPIGRFVEGPDVIPAKRQGWIAEIAAAPPILRGAVDFARTFRRPDSQVVTLDRALQVYAWHGRHHTAHIASLCERMHWR